MTYNAGQFFVVRTKGFPAFVIRLVTRSWANHAGLVVSSSGVTVEAKGGGVCYGTLGSYGDDELRLSHFDLADVQASEIVEQAKSLIGRPYGWADLLWLGLLQWPVTWRWEWIRRRVDDPSRLVCSQLVAFCYESANVELSYEVDMPLDVTPADLARRIGA